CLMYCFFFSSRRRHTRFSRDWSSDVCSSDLLLLQLDLSSPFVFIAGLGIGDDGFQRSALGSVFRNSARAFVFARNHRGLGHGLQIGRASCRERGGVSVLEVAWATRVEKDRQW